MNAKDNLNAIEALDLEPIKVKLMHEESGEGWTLERANAIEFEYRRFLVLMKKFPQEQTAPLVDVDTFWHYHILDTMKYAADCDAVFGYFLHHFPYIGLRGEDDEAAHQRVGQRMQELYEATFGEPYVRGATEPAAFSGVAPQTAFSGAANKTAFSGVATQTATSGVATNTAFSGVATQTAFSGVAPQTAFSGVATKAAFSGVATRAAFSGAANQTAFSGVAAKTAFSGVASKAAFSGAVATAEFYTERPRLPATA